MKNLIVILLTAAMLIMLIGCDSGADSFTISSRLIEPEIVTESVDNNEADEKTDPVATEPPKQSEETSTFPSDNATDSSKALITQQETSTLAKSSQKTKSSDYNNQLPTRSEPSAAPFDPSPYAAEAIRHGESIGLIHDELYVSKGNWNPWVNLNDKLSEAQMMQNIRDALQILVNEDREYFFVYCEPQSDGSYHMFIFFG